MAGNSYVIPAVIITLFASAMWGSWMQIIKRCPQYPVCGITMVIYTVSFLALAAVCLAAGGRAFPQGFSAYLRDYAWEVPRIALGGGAAALGVLVSLKLMRNAGLVVGTAVSGAAGSITGVLVAVAREGLPQIPFGGLALAVCTGVTVLAGVLCSLASAANSGEKSRLPGQNILLLAAFVLLSNGYIYGTSTGIHSGMAPLPICLFLSSGAFVAALSVGIITVTARRQWRQVLCIGSSKKPLLLGALSALFHYGGNFLSILCMPVLSATLSFLIGRSANIWTFFFGIYLGEFKHSGRKVHLLLYSGIAMYILGILLIALFFY